MLGTELRDKIARYITSYLDESNPGLTEKISVGQIKDIAEIGMRLTIDEVDAMLLKQMKSRLENLIPDD